MNNLEKTLVIIKPDAIERNLVGKIISKYEDKNLKIKELKILKASNELLEKHYAEHKGKSFYNELLNYMKSDLCIVMILEGSNAIESVRNINGATDPLKALTGSIRGDYAFSKTKNLVHASDSIESAKREISIWF
ncbi:MAG: nucleoside-diphosphate kinase [Peptostreptococcaceae bacterium]|jgi:nucleoside-diphosphate kinase|nr:nucleoside-diphosphate kinase [Peptostreptococcaceae bacterium]